jgi:predicted DNA repair protein MutK
MAGTSLLTLLDDIATILDDVAVMTKVAAKKTAGVLGDDLALNAEQVAGVSAERELPVVWAVAKGSMKNKAILVPAGLLISAFVPWLVVPLLMIGGAFLCFEGFEKVAHKLLHSDKEEAEHHDALLKAVVDPTVDLVALEKDKIAGAVRTDFILSAEIIVISLGAVSDKPLATQIGVLVAIAVAMNIGVYGLVAGIVKLDDAGAWLIGARGGKPASPPLQLLGRGILAAAPYLMKTLSIVGTAAMFLVGGGIIAHGIPPVEHLVHDLVTGRGGFVEAVGPTLANGLIGIVAGGLVLLGVKLVGGVVRRVRGPKAA